jgi:CRP-like cAMP-binding protein
MSGEALENERRDVRQLLGKKLNGYDTLSGAETSAIEDAMGSCRLFDANADLVRVGESPDFSTLILNGWAARYKSTEEGARQITAVHIPGDFVDLHSFLLRPMDHSVVALSSCRVAMFPHHRLRVITERHPHLTRLLWLNTLVDAALHREWLLMMRLRAGNHLAHLICELYLRLDAVGLISNRAFEFPITQAVVADMLGISPVHVNRALQEVRARELLTWQNKIVTILKWEELKAFAQFDPTYLFQEKLPR